MMEKSVWLRVSGPNIVHEDFGDEMVVVNLDTGKYYAFTPVAADLWSHLQGGATVDSLVTGTQLRYAGDPTEIERAVLTFLEGLLAEALLLSAAAPPGDGRGALVTGGDKLPFAAPTFEVFSDMEDLLLLDPIHDVDESGWPNLPTTEQ